MMLNKYEEVTYYNKPTKKIKSTYGEISYHAWCFLEVVRINKDIDRRAFVAVSNGDVCVAEWLTKDGERRYPRIRSKNERLPEVYQRRAEG